MMISIKSDLSTQNPLMEMVRGKTDLRYINQKLLEFGFSQTVVGTVEPHQGQIVTPIVNHPSPSSLKVQYADGPNMLIETGAFEPMSPEVIGLISPDSSIPCDSPDCPIKAIPHNIGRYFHHGEAPRPLEASSNEANIRGSREDVSSTFNRTIPPPAIVTAYLRTCVGLHTQADSDMVRQYQKHHMWSPIIDDPSTPWPRDIFPNMHGLHGQGTSSGTRVEETAKLYDANTDDETTQGVVQKRLFDEDSITRLLQASDFEDSDEEDDLMFTPLSYADYESSSPSFWSSDSVPNEREEYAPDVELSPAREMLYGHELASEQLQLQQRMLRRMAVHQRLNQARRGEICVGWCGKKESFECPYNDEDVALEILLELMEALPQALEDGDLRSIFLDDKCVDRGFSESEHRLLCDAQIMLEKVLADTISNATGPYQPTGLPVTTAQLHTELASVLSTQQHMLAANPGKSIAEIITPIPGSRKAHCAGKYERYFNFI